MKVGQTQLTVLRWMQQNVWKCMNTTSLSLARKIAEDSVNAEWPIVHHKHHIVKRPCWECGCKTKNRYNVITPLHDHLNLCEKCVAIYKEK